VLARAHANRTKVLYTRAAGIRFSGLDEWMGYLNELETAFEDSRLLLIKFLVSRIRSDYEVAIEATLAGLPCAVFDSMRDVMEVNLLLEDFAADKNRLSSWLSADNKTLIHEFMPKHLRQRKAKRAGLAHVKDLTDSRDYFAHSHALHVQPQVYPYERRGLVELGHPVLDDFCYWEMFGHALSLCATLEALVKTLAPDLTITSQVDVRLPKVHEAWVRVHELPQLMNALAQAAEKSGDTENGADDDDG
jgi:hypothetical protein